jgi:hypothetical protein
MYIHLYCEIGTGNTNGEVFKPESEGWIEYFIYGLVVEDDDKQRA